MTLNEKLKSISNPPLPTCPTGYALNVAEFWNQFVEPMLPQKDVVLGWHNLLMKYIKEDDAVFVIREFHNVKIAARRGLLTKTNQGYSFFYSDNSFATYIAKMVYDGFVPTYEDFKRSMLSRTFPASWFASKEELEKAAYPLDRKSNPQISASGYKLAHIVDSGDHFYINNADWNRSKICNKYFPAGKFDDWKLSEDEHGKFYVRKLDIPAEAKNILISLFLRYVDPLNYFLTPKPKNNGESFHFMDVSIPKNDIAEYEMLQLFAMNKFLERYGTIYEDFLELLKLCPKQNNFKDFNSAGASIIKIHYGRNIQENKIPVSKNNLTIQHANSNHKVVEYSFSRLCFKADIIEPLDMDDVFICATPKGKFAMTKRQFYEVFASVPETRSYKEDRIYHYSKTPAKAQQFLI